MSKPYLGVKRTRELLDELRRLVGDFAARETKVNRAYDLKSGQLRASHEEELEALEAEAGERAGAARETLGQAKNDLKRQYESRLSKIGLAHKASKRRLEQQTVGKEGQRKINLQRKAIQSGRDRDAALADASKAFTELNAIFASEAESLGALRKKSMRSFGDFGGFKRRLAKARRKEAEVEVPDDVRRDALEKIVNIRGDAEEKLAQFRRAILPMLFRIFPAPLAGGLLIAVHATLAFLAQKSEYDWFTYQVAAMSLGGCLGVLFFFYLIVRIMARGPALSIAGAVAKAEHIMGATLEEAEGNRVAQKEQIEKDYESLSSSLDDKWNRVVEETAEVLESRPEQLDRQAERLRKRADEIYRTRLEELSSGRDDPGEEFLGDAERREAEMREDFERKSAETQAEHSEAWRVLEEEWQRDVGSIHAELLAANAAAEELFPQWEPSLWADWSPPQEFAHVARFARLEVDLEKIAEEIPGDERLALPEPVRFQVPLLVSLPEEGSLLFETVASGQEDAVGALNNIVLRLLSVAPPGRLSFTIVDPVGLGENFAGVMHLADYEEHLINSRIWTQGPQIEQRLAELNEHMEKVIQMYLRNEYETITEYNLQAGNIAEKYHFLVIADFPSGFTEVGIKRLMSIASSGARCGVYTLIQWDHRQSLAQDFVADDLRKSSAWINFERDGLKLSGEARAGVEIKLDAPPEPEFAIEFTNKVGQASIDSNRVEVPFSQVAPGEDEEWTSETTDELRVPIGRTGATKLQYLAIGKGTRQHALIAGKTGSGKSTLFHVMITNLALWCRPDQVEFYLVDFKKGVEFKAYAAARLPHARVIAIESDREFGLSVLQRVDDELKRRGDMFRDLGVQDVAGYKKAGGAEPVPRSLLLIDEFQEFFVEDDRISQNAAVLLDRIVRQGRAFGIHVILGSQTLGGAFTLARTTLGQMVIRIALQCNEADSYLIMDDNNPAPRMLTRPGEGIYNDNAGMLEGNSPFQVVWLPDEVREENLQRVRQLADESGEAWPDPIVFEGNVPAEIRENAVLREMLDAPSVEPVAVPRIFLGSPNSIKGPTEASFHRQSGNNLLIVGQREEAALAILSVGLVSLGAQFPRGKARFLLLDSSPPESPNRELMDRVIEAVPHEIELLKAGDAGAAIAELGVELRNRGEEGFEGEAKTVFLLVNGLQRFKKLRFEEDFSFTADDSESAPEPGIELDNLIRDGASHGIHVIASIDTYNNVNRFLSRKAISEFEMRVLFQMSANDSASLIDTPKASGLGLNRALFYNEQEGYLETFRPYSTPGDDWFEEAGRKLRELPGSAV